MLNLLMCWVGRPQPFVTERLGVRKRTDFFHLHCGMCGCPIVEVYRITGNSYGFFPPLFSSHHTLGASSDTSVVILGRGCHCANEASLTFVDAHVCTGTRLDPKATLWKNVSIFMFEIWKTSKVIGDLIGLLLCASVCRLWSLKNLSGTNLVFTCHYVIQLYYFIF